MSKFWDVRICWDDPRGYFERHIHMRHEDAADPMVAIARCAEVQTCPAPEHWREASAVVVECELHGWPPR